MDQIIKKISCIPQRYRPIPFWSWNDDLRIDELKRQIRWMHKNGIGGFFMHARGGLKTPYLGEEWMKAVEACCEEAKLLGMNAWVYDENGWPSGFAGGKLLEKEENRDMYILHQIGAWDAKADVSYLITDTSLDRCCQYGEDGTYLNLYLCRSASTVDILNPDVVKQFVEVTHEKYQEHFELDFSNKVFGFFTDEPQYYRAATPYTPVLEEYFREKYGVDIFDQLGLLFLEKEEYRIFRYRYWLAMQTLMLENFSRQVYDWCCDRNVCFTGHYVEETTLGGQMMCCGGVMPFYEYEHIPGIDWLGRDTASEVSPRQLGSASRQLGKKQTLTETFACCGWNVTPAQLKRIAGFQYACGANLLCQHLLPYSEHGQRKKDYPAHFNPINPWIEEHFKDFNDYFARLGYLLSESEEPVNVAMLHPMRSAYFGYKRGNDASAIPESELDPMLNEACRALSCRGIGYHFLDETLLERHGFVSGRRIGCGMCSYTYLVIPKILTMGYNTERLLREYIANGGKVLLLDEKPAYLEGEPFAYSYLESNCTLSEIAEAQPFSVGNIDTELYYTYRIYDGKSFLFVQNASDEESITQHFRFTDNIRSLIAVDPSTLEQKALPLTVTFGKNEGFLLFLSEDPAPETKNLETRSLRFQNADVLFDNNYLTLDTVQYSCDGVHYSKQILCTELCNELLRQRYDGKIWLKYLFEIKKVPDTLRLLAEKSDSFDHKVNGKPIIFDRTLAEEPCVYMADIITCVNEGINQYEMALNWHQSEQTYYALFGEGVTESLRNCIAYDSEIEPIYLTGNFGVYSHAPYEPFCDKYYLGHHFYIDSMPKKISEPVTDGMPFFRGEMTVRQSIFLDSPQIQLELPGEYLWAKIWVNGQYAGEICYQQTLDVSSAARSGKNDIKIVFCVGNRNLLGPHHYSGQERAIGPDAFEKNELIDPLTGTVKYKLCRFYPADSLEFPKGQKGNG